ncbi:MAG: MATE family efflux transporter [Eubacterium sp.]|nr:MATE family efflux transporter [Eubacterium sp.]
MKRNRNLYRQMLTIAIPIMIQNGITEFVNMLDNIMVGHIGTDPMSGVSIITNLMFVSELTLFGALSGIGIFTAQFFGKKDHEGIRYTFRLMLIVSLAVSVIAFLVLFFAQTPLIGLYLHEDGGIGNMAATMQYAKQYLSIVLIGLFPFAVSQSYGMLLKSTGDTVIPMISGVVAVGVNLLGNYILIYGKWGAPALGVAGAAIATVLSRFVEMAVIVIYTHLHTDKYPFMKKVYSKLYVPRSLIINCAKKGTPLMLNEMLWAASVAALTQSYSVRGLSVVAGFNITMAFSNIVNVVFVAMGIAIGIIIGQKLGEGETETVREDAKRLILFGVALSFIALAVEIAISGIFPQIYNTSDEIRKMATGMIQIFALSIPFHAYATGAYFTLRSGGKTIITFLFDSVFAWVISIPLAFVLSRFTNMPILPLYFWVRMTEGIKCLLGWILLKKGSWVNDLTKYEAKN